MSTTQLRIAGAGLLFLVIFAFGFWLSRSGKPYNQALFTIHKLAALGAVILLAITIYKVHQLTPLGSVQIIAVAVTAIFILAMFVTGALLSAMKDIPLIVLRLHQGLPYLALLSTGALLYLLLVNRGMLVEI